MRSLDWTIGLGLISPTCLRAAFTDANPKSAKAGQATSVFLRFWDL